MINHRTHSGNAQRPHSSCNLGHWKQRRAEGLPGAKHHRNVAKSGPNRRSQSHLQFQEAFELCAGKWVREGAPETGGGKKLLTKGHREEKWRIRWALSGGAGGALRRSKEQLLSRQGGDEALGGTSFTFTAPANTSGCFL